MNTVVAFCFLIILALLLFSISFGLRFYEGRRRKSLVSSQDSEAPVRLHLPQ